MNIFTDIDISKLHHAYLIEGERELIIPEIKTFVQSMGVSTEGNPDFSHIHLDTIKVEDARNFKSLTLERGYTDGKKVFLVSSNSILLEAQNTMLKLFEEPIENTVFFVVVPDRNALLPTFISRFYFISSEGKGDNTEAEKFIKMPMQMRINYIKDLVTVDDEDDIAADSTRAKALKFLNELETELHRSYTDQNFRISSFEQIMKVRKLLRMPGSSPKMLLESIALMI